MRGELINTLRTDILTNYNVMLDQKQRQVARILVHARDVIDDLSLEPKSTKSIGSKLRQTFRSERQRANSELVASSASEDARLKLLANHLDHVWYSNVVLQ